MYTKTLLSLFALFALGAQLSLGSECTEPRHRKRVEKIMQIEEQGR